MLCLHELPEQGCGEAALGKHERKLDPPGSLGHLDPGRQPAKTTGAGDLHAPERLHGHLGLLKYLGFEGGWFAQRLGHLVPVYGGREADLLAFVPGLLGQGVVHPEYATCLMLLRYVAQQYPVEEAAPHPLGQVPVAEVAQVRCDQELAEPPVFVRLLPLKYRPALTDFLAVFPDSLLAVVVWQPFKVDHFSYSPRPLCGLARGHAYVGDRYFEPVTYVVASPELVAVELGPVQIDVQAALDEFQRVVEPHVVLLKEYAERLRGYGVLVFEPRGAYVHGSEVEEVCQLELDVSGGLVPLCYVDVEVAPVARGLVEGDLFDHEILGACPDPASYAL